MPTMLKVKGYRFQIYRRDRPPAHAHVKREGKELVISLLKPMTVLDNAGFSEAELAEILEIMDRRGGTFVYAYWDRYHQER